MCVRPELLGRAINSRFASDARKGGMMRGGKLLESDLGGEAFPVSERHSSTALIPRCWCTGVPLCQSRRGRPCQVVRPSCGAAQEPTGDLGRAGG